MTLVLLALPILVAANLEALEDWWKLRGYVPSSSIVKLANEDTMTDKARHLFYINHPQLVDDKSQLRQFCPQNEQTIVLGCYRAVQGGIAIFDVTDQRLSGVEEVTAAHEMLHAAYDRLDKKDKDYVNGLLNDYYMHSLGDNRIAKTIQAYQMSEPNDVVNEMHSIFGTEIASLPVALENYYKKYFNDRSQVTNFSSSYQSVFTQNQQQLDSLKKQIDSTKDQLVANKEEIENEEDSLQTESQRMRSLLSDGNTEEYNQAVGPYNARVNNLRALINSYNSRVERLNNMIEQYNNLAYNQESLYQSLDTRVQTQPVR